MSRDIGGVGWFYPVGCPQQGHESPHEGDNQKNDDRPENRNPHGTTSAAILRLHHRPIDILPSNRVISEITDNRL
jgi:hypothetical protein